MKTGRNDPCPCASGKKWKKCCAPVTPVVAAPAIAAADATADDGATAARPVVDLGHTWVPLQHQARLLRAGNFGRKKPY
jgi:SEC-C motif